MTPVAQPVIAAAWERAMTKAAQRWGRTARLSARLPRVYNIFRLDIPVHDARRVGGSKCAGDLQNNIQGHCKVNAAPQHLRPQRFPFNMLGGDVVNSIDFAYFVNRHDIWMMLRAGGLCFTHKTTQPFGIVGVFL